MLDRNRLLTTALSLPLIACTGGGKSTPAGPQSLTYASAGETLLVGVVAPPMIPSLSGGPAVAFQIEPELPQGLGLEAHGTIGGIPLAASPLTTYRVSAANAAGSVETSLTFEVLAQFPAAKFVYGVHLDESRLAGWRFDAKDGRLVPIGSVRTALAPLRAVSDPLGRFVYVSSAGQGIGVHRVDPETGGLGPVELEATDGGSFELALSPDGRCLYLTNLGSQSVEAFRIDPLTGGLSKVGASVPLPSPTDLAVSPDGRYLAVALYQPGGIAIFELDPLSGSIAAPLAAELADTPIDLEFSADGQSLYAASFTSARVQRFRFTPQAGSLMLVENEPCPLGPLSLEIDGSQLLVACADGQALARYALANDGSFSFLDQRPLPARPGQVRLLPDGQILTPFPEEAGFAVVSPTDFSGLLAAQHVTRPGLLDLLVVRGPQALESELASLFVSATSSGYVHALQAVDGTLLEQGPANKCGERPSGLAYDPEGVRLFAAEQLSSGIAVQTLDPLLGSLGPCSDLLPAGTLPRDLALSPENSHLAAATNEGLALWRVASEATGQTIAPVKITTVPAGLSPSAIEFHPSGRTLYSADRGSDQVTVCRFDPFAETLINLGSVALGTGSRPRDLDVSLDGRFLAVACSGDNSVRLLSISPIDGWPSEVARFETGQDPRAVAFSRDSRLLAVGQFGADRVDLLSVLDPDGTPILSTYGPAIGVTEPHALAFSPEGNSLLIASFGTDQIQRASFDSELGLSGAVTAASLPLGSGPVALALRVRWSPSPE